MYNEDRFFNSDAIEIRALERKIEELEFYMMSNCIELSDALIEYVDFIRNHEEWKTNKPDRKKVVENLIIDEYKRLIERDRRS